MFSGQTHRVFYGSFADSFPLTPPPPQTTPAVPGGAGPPGPGREAGARARRAAQGHGGEQQLQPNGRGEAPAEDGADRGEPNGLPGCHDGAPAGEGEPPLHRLIVPHLVRHAFTA